MAKKTLILVACSLYSFLGNSALLGPSVYIGIYAQEFGVSPNTASGLISYANLAFGFGQSREASSAAGGGHRLTKSRVAAFGSPIPQDRPTACDAWFSRICKCLGVERHVVGV